MRYRFALLLALAAFVACRDGRTAEAQTEPTVTPRGEVVAPGTYHVFGADGMLGTYHDDHVAVEVVDGSDDGIAILQLWGNRGPDANGIALAVDEQRGWSEIHANAVGRAEPFPLILYANRVGVGQPEPRARLDVAGGVRLSGGERPDCTDARRGTLWFDRGAAGEADRVVVCMRAADGSHAWAPLTP